jgi:outer membrane protein LpxR
MPALASEPFALELRGGASVLSGPESFRLYYLGDNDSIPPLIAPTTGLPYDRWYSASTMLGARWALRPELLRLPSEARVLLSTSLGQNIYTPRTAMIATEADLQGDRPYSGWLKGSLGLDVLLPAAPLAFTHGGRPYSHLSVDLHGGTQGPWSFAGWTQFHAHNFPAYVTGQLLPPEVGWGVIETRPGLAGDVSLFAETTLAALEGAGPSWMEWSGGHPSLHWMAGASGHAGSMLLAGSMHTSLTAGWTGDPLARDAAFIPMAAYVYLRGEVRGVGYNATIDGPILDGAMVARHEPLVGEVAFGAVLRAWRLEASVGPVYRTNEVASLQRDLRVGQLIWQGSVSYVQ